MIIQCEQCRTKFRLDDEKVSDRGVKVRCAKCRHVFTVRRDVEQTEMESAETPIAAPHAPEEATPFGSTPAAAVTPEPAIAFDFGGTPQQASAPPESSFEHGQVEKAVTGGFDFGDVSFEAAAPAAPSEVDFGDMAAVVPPPKIPEPASDFSLDFGAAAVPAPEPAADVSFDFGDALAPGSSVSTQKVEFDFGDSQPAPAAAAGDVDLGGFDFGEATGTAVAPSAGIDNTDFSDFSAAAAPKAAAGDLGFSFDDAVPQAAASADNLDLSGVDFGSTAAATGSPAPAAPVDSFKLEEVDFSGDTAAVAVAATETASAGALFAPVDESVAQQQVAAAVPDITFDAPASPAEAPPLAITSRRRQNSTVSIVIGVLVVAIVGVLGYLAFSMFGKTDIPVDDGKITVRNVKAYFIPKAAAGELLVITGEAQNNHKKARAALQVKGMVYGANNQPLANKTAYAGNPLTQEQLAAMTAEKIESAMNNQFGDSLANLEVQPGKIIPFTIVIINPPKEGKDFGVEPVGSTVAASK